MKRVRAQGCHTLYKSQVILSTKDTPLVPKLCIKSQHDGVLDRPPVILLPATHLLEAVGGVKGARRGVGVPHLEVDLLDAARRQRLENLTHERASQPGTTAGGGDGKVQDLAFVSGIERNHVAQDRTTISLRDEKLGKRHAVAEILRGPRIAEDLLLDRVNGCDVAQPSGTNAAGGGRNGSPISLEPLRVVRRQARRRSCQRGGCARPRTRRAQATIRRWAGARRGRRVDVGSIAGPPRGTAPLRLRRRGRGGPVLPRQVLRS